MRGPDPSRLLHLAERTAQRAGEELLARRADAGMVRYKSSETDPVSEADSAAEALIVAALLRARPDDGLLAEEGSQRSGTTGLRWVVDPLDGTVNYLYGIPAWSVSIAVEDSQGALAGVVHDPSRDETWTAVRGGGARRDGRPVHVNDPVELGKALVATGFSYDPVARRRQATVAAAVLGRVRDVRRFGSAALDLCAVAGGLVDAYYEHTLSPWDWAAGALVARESGAVVSRLGAGLVVAGPALHPQLSAALEDAGLGEARGEPPM